MLSILLAIAALNSTASAETTVRCGGSYGQEELTFRQNPLNKVWSTMTKDETFTVYVDATRGEKIRVVTAEVVADAEWEKLKVARDASGDKTFQDLVSRLGSTKLLDMWMGWTNDGFIHFEGTQREAKFTFSCSK